MAEMKKNAQINIFMRIKQKIGFVLPILLIIIFIAIIAVWVSFYLKAVELEMLKEKKITLEWKMSEYTIKKDELIAYTNMKNAYNKYIQNLINYDLIFDTIKNYIPTDAKRSTLTITKKWSNITVWVNTEIQWYEEYMTFLRVIDKCSFSSDAQKQSLLNIQRVELWWEEGKEKLTDPVSINLYFNFSPADNEFVLQKKYDKTTQEFDDLWKFINFINVSKWLNPWNFSNTQDYWDELKEFYNKKDKFANKIAKIQNTDENGFYKVWTWENFISTIKRENILIWFLIEYYKEYKKELESNLLKIYNNWDIVDTYIDRNTDTEKTIIVLNLKENHKEYILEINTKILELTLIKRYNEYLLNKNYLNTFEKIKRNGSKKYTIITNNVEETLSADEYITYLISEYGILTEDDKILIDTIRTDRKKIIDWLSTFEDKTEEEIQKEIKAQYTKYINFIKWSDSKKKELLNINTYLDGYYSDYIKYNLYHEWIQILDYFFNSSQLDLIFLNNIKYSFFDFSVKDDLLIFKKRFLLTIENNRKLAAWINKLKTENWFLEEIKKTENFIKKTTDIILAWHNNIDCLYKDVKMETKDIYTSILKWKQEEQEKAKNVKEIDIIINNFSNKVVKNDKTEEKNNRN